MTSSTTTAAPADDVFGDLAAIEAELQMVEDAAQAEREDASKYTGRVGGSATSNQYGTFQVHYVTGRQLSFLSRLVAERDTVGLGIPADLAKVSKDSASRFIDALLKRPVRAGVEVVAPKASDAQVNFIKSLIEQRDLSVLPTGGADRTLIANMEAGTLTKAGASDLIATLKSCPRPALTTTQALAERKDGMYLKDGVVFKVQYNLAKTGCYAKRLVQDGHGEAHFDYAGSLAANGLKPEHKMTLEQAKEYGSLYGTCCNCGRTLTDEQSIAAGIGPICASKF
jgi:hypothetical protein